MSQTTPDIPLPEQMPALALRRKSRRALWVAGAGALLCLPPYLGFMPLWARIADLHGALFMLAAAAFGLLLVAGPLLILAGVLVAAFLRVEAITQSGESPRSVTDWCALALALLLSFAPALGATWPAFQALLTGGVRYKFPSTTVLHSVDPLGYWQGIAFWFMGAAALALLAGFYWRSRWQRCRRTQA